MRLLSDISMGSSRIPKLHVCAKNICPTVSEQQTQWDAPPSTGNHKRRRTIVCIEANDVNDVSQLVAPQPIVGG